MHRALLDHMAKFNNLKDQINQEGPSGLTKAILWPHVRFKLDDDDNDNEKEAVFSCSIIPNPNNEWIAQFSDPRAMEKLVENWGMKCNKAADHHATCATLIKKMLCEYSMPSGPFMTSLPYDR